MKLWNQLEICSLMWQKDRGQKGLGMEPSQA